MTEPEKPTDNDDASAAGSGNRQIMPGWYVIYQQQNFVTGPPGTWVDSGRLHVTTDPLVVGGTIETYYLNLDHSGTGGGLLQASGAPGLEVRRVFESPGAPGRLDDALRFLKAPGNLSQPPGIRSSRITCKCARPVTLNPPP